MTFENLEVWQIFDVWWPLEVSTRGSWVRYLARLWVGDSKAPTMGRSGTLDLCILERSQIQGISDNISERFHIQKILGDFSFSECTLWHWQLLARNPCPPRKDDVCCCNSSGFVFQLMFNAEWSLSDYMDYLYKEKLLKETKTSPHISGNLNYVTSFS